MPEVMKKENKLLNEVNSFIDKYIHHLSKTEVNLLMTNENGRYSVIMCKIEIKIDGIINDKEVDLDYGKLRFIRFRFPTAEIGEYLNKIYLEQTLKVPKIGSVDLKIRSEFQSNLEMRDMHIHKYSHESWFPIKNDWPCYLLSMQLDDIVVDYSAPLIKKSLPAYSNISFALTDLFNFSYSGQINQYRNLYVMISDPRAKIEHLQLAGTLVELVLVCGVSKLNNLLIKVFAKKGECMDTQEEFNPESEIIKVNLKFEPEFLEIFLLDNDTGEEIDWKKIDLIWGYKTNKTDITDTENDLIEWIRHGEGENVEFKSEIVADSTKLNLRKTVTAFSNTKGGFIFVGIDDSGSPIKDCNMRDETVIQLLGEIEPTPKFQTQRLKLEEKSILVIKVEEGDIKPYVLKEHGILLRKGSTNVMANRLELMSLFKRSNG